MTSPDLALQSLSRLPNKIAAYARDIYFREGAADVAAVFGDDAAPAIRAMAFAILKGDALAAGKAPAILDFCEAHGFRVAAAAEAQLDHRAWREMWRYQLNAATLDRLALNDVVLRYRVVALGLRDLAPAALPASVRLSGLKGPSDVAAQPPDCLRRLLGQPNRLLSYLHVADEPADVVREIAILFDRPARLAFLEQWAADRLDRAGLRDRVAQLSGHRDLEDLAGALARARAAIASASGPLAARADAVARLDRAAAGEPLAWRDFAESVACAGAVIDGWDQAVIGGRFCVHDEPGHPKFIEGVPASAWADAPAQPS